MAFDLDKFKGKTIDDTLLGELKAHLDELDARAATAEGKAKTAQKESIDGRKALKAERDAAFERLGVATMEELEALPEAKGQAEAMRQVEAKVKKLEKDLAEKAAAHDELSGKYATERRQRAIAQAVSKLDFIDPEDAVLRLERGTKEDGDALMFDAGDGKPMKLDDAAAWIAKSKPHLVKPAGGGGGSGTRPNGSKGGDLPKKPERKDFPNDVEFAKAEATHFRAQQDAAATTH
jgi:hypothetical protein